jgi:hypothetical protein
MKQMLLLLSVVFFTNLLFAQSDKYIEAMKKNIIQIDSSMQKGNATELANNFERIGDAEKTQWLPYYYASYCTIIKGFTDPDKTKSDATADKAEQLISKSEEILGKENSETDVIKSMIASLRLMVDPQNRWQQYGPISSQNIEKAKELDPANPRPILLEGQAKFYTPESFGGGKAVAKPLFEKAIPMFDAFQPESELHPTWGKTTTEYFLSQCN